MNECCEDLYLFVFFCKKDQLFFLNIFSLDKTAFFVFTKTKTFLLSRVTGYGYCLFLADQPKFYNRRYE